MNNYLIFLKYYEQIKGRSDLTIRSYRFDLESFVKFLDGKNMDEEMIDQYIYYLSEKGVSSKTINRRLAAITAFSEWLLLNGCIDKNLAADVKRFRTVSKGRSVLSVEDFNDMLNVADKDYFSKLRNDSIVSLLFFSGIRSNELLNIKDDNICMNKMEIKVKVKGGDEKIAFFNSKCRALLSEYILCKGFSFYTFVNKKNKRISDRYLRILVKKIAVKAGITKEVSPHVFRHSFATAALNAGVGVRELQELMNLKSSSTVQVYARTSRDALRTDYNDFIEYLSL